ncbi:MAG: hypothetical protein M1832_003140 [Thelocarpon impressellum]|nr:MAG: hypothetical protein M1832_003140 [Thelocarpon impressellum]
MAKITQTEQSDYEAERLANIAQNKALIAQLKLDAAAQGVSQARAQAKASSTNATSNKRKKPAAPAVKKEADILQPRRTSSRLAGLTADSEVAKRKAENEYEAVQAAARAKRQRVSGDLNLADIVVAGKMWDRSENFLVDAVAARPARYSRTFGDEDVKSTGDKGLRELRERMSGLRLYGTFEPNQIKITPERIYSLGFHPNPAKALVFAGDKLGNLGIFDASQSPGASGVAIKSEDVKVEEDGDEDEEDEAPFPTITAFHLHTRTISTFLFPPTSPSTLLSASYDSSIRSLDLNAARATEVYAPADPDSDEPISGLAVPPSERHMLYFTTLQGAFGRHDTRAPSATATATALLSDKKIGGFSLHPGMPHLLATASLDRTLKIWDLRKLSGADKTPACLGEHESRLSVSHAAWNSAGLVATASYDDTVKVHDFSGCGGWKAGHQIGEEGMRPKTVIPHNNQTGRWVTILRAQWQEQPQDGIHKLCIGNMNRYVDVYSAAGEQLAQLGGDGITAVPAVAQFHPTEDWIAAGTASGKLCLWM